jgi:hypothetical protein
MSEQQIWSLIIALAVLSIPFAVIEYIRVQRHKHHPSDQQYRYTSFNRVRRTAKDHQYDYTPSAEVSFEQRLAAAGMKPDQTVTFGQITLAYDREKGKLLVQTQHIPEGVLLRPRDVLAYALLCDGRMTAQRSRESGEGIAAITLDSDCGRIELRLETKHKDYPQMTLVLMPFRFERAEARASAMDAARKIVEVLDRVLEERE